MRSIKICCSLTRFPFGVGFNGIDQDLLLPDQISLWSRIQRDRSRSVAPGPNFSLGWDLFFHLNDLLLLSATKIKDFVSSNMLIFICCQCH